MSLVVRIAVIGIVSTLLIASTLAREAPDLTNEAAGPPTGAAGERRGGSGGVGFGPIGIEVQLKTLQKVLKVSDEDEWKGLAPKLERVLIARQNMNTGARIRWQSRNGAKPIVEASDAKPDTAPGKAMQAVRDAIAEEASDEQLAKAMAAVREARRQARAEFDAAQEALTAALTPRQEALLMTLGVVE